MKIAICEDLKIDSEHIYKLIEEYAKVNRLNVDIDVYFNGEDFLKNFKPDLYQIVFLDIYMDKSGITGMDVAKKIRKTDADVAIIFNTMSLEHAVSSYQVDANYYIVKPVTKNEFNKAMDKCKEKINLYGTTIEIMVNRELIKICLKDIYCLEAMSHNTIIYTSHGDFSPNMTIGNLKDQLGGYPFISCHRSYIVNLLHVVDLDNNDFILSNKQRVPISKGLKKHAQDEFRKFFFDI